MTKHKKTHDPELLAQKKLSSILKLINYYEKHPPKSKNIKLDSTITKMKAVLGDTAIPNDVIKLELIKGCIHSSLHPLTQTKHKHHIPILSALRQPSLERNLLHIISKTPKNKLGEYSALYSAREHLKDKGIKTWVDLSDLENLKHVSKSVAAKS